MARYTDIVTDPDFHPIPGVIVSVITGTGTLATLFADDGSSLSNPFTSSDLGEVTFNAADSVYTVTYRYGGRIINEISALVGNPPQFIGETGPSNNTRLTLADLKTAAITDVSSLYDGAVWFWRFGDYSATPAPDIDVNVVKANSTSLTVGAWIRQPSSALTYQRAPNAAGAVAQPVSSVLDTLGISPRAFGATEADADQSAAIQKAIDFCLSFNPPAPLRVDGYFRVDHPLMINRPVTTAASWFTIMGVGLSSGFRTTQNINIFDTTVTLPGRALVSGMVVFRNLNLVAADGVANAYMLGQGLLYLTIADCTFYRAKLVNASVYSQSIRVRDSVALYWTGDWWKNDGAYDCHIDSLRVGFGEYLLTWNGSSPIMRASMSNCDIEGIITAFRGSAIVEMSFPDNYVEALSGPSYDFTYGGKQNVAISVTDSTFNTLDGNVANTAFYDIKWGNTLRAGSSYNWCNSRMHDTTGVTGANLLAIEGDVVALELYKGFKSGFGDPAFAGVGNVNLQDADYGFISARGSVWSSSTRAGSVGPGQAYGPGVVQNGAYVPVRVTYGNANPQTSPATYGNPYWTAGSRVIASPTAVGQPREFVCTVSGQPGTWVAVNL